MNIYFNRCFTQTAEVINLIKHNEDGREFNIFVSHSESNSYLEEAADFFEIEPEVTGREYLNYILNFCLKHKIDIFIPRKNMEELSHYQKEFELIGVKALFIGPSSIYDLLSDKIKTYAHLKHADIVNIPKTYKVSTYADFKEAYSLITSTGNIACMKPISGIGGEGFKIIRENISEIDELYTSSSISIPKSRIERVLSTSSNIKPFMMSVYMKDEEYSIDCLAKDGELIVGIPRRKIDRYRNSIEYRYDLLDIARRLTKRYNLSALYNIQVRYHKGEPYLIEINTRMSGGIYKSCLTGINLPYLAIKNLLGEDIKNMTFKEEDVNITSLNSFKVSRK